MIRARATTLTAVILTVIAAACATTTDPLTPGTSSERGDPQRILDKFDVQGHRGARGLKPENTLPAFEAALDLGVSTLELDLHFTADGEVVISHDPAIDPAKCGLRPGAPAGIPDPDDPETSPSELAIRTMTAQDIQWFVCDRNPDPGKFPQQTSDPTAVAGDNFSMVTLDQLIDFVQEYASSETKTEEQRNNARSVVFNVETKRKANDPARIGDGFDGVNAGPFEIKLLEIINDRQIRGRVIVQSFDLRSIRAINAVDPTIRLSALTSDGSIRLAEYVAAGATIWSPRASTVTADLVTQAHALGLAVIPWTVNETDEIDRLTAMGVDGIITDLPGLFVGR
ncbi:Glycerophosphoryl diester phosphodiesterase [hydrothermal vent metagenome]|uniref:Glycerophosphoryl diester phosphodiesterase n=1 Tax=hydrothermal vent metagenome TaxID=652676 RepID=A0A3B0SSK0_9ZZZZ